MDIPLISYISSILSRLSYMNNTNFLHYYDEIFKELINNGISL